MNTGTNAHVQMVQGFVRAIHEATLDDVPTLRAVLAMGAAVHPDPKLQAMRAQPAAHHAQQIASAPPQVSRALNLLGDVVEQAPELSDAELLDKLRAFADLFAPLIFDDPQEL